MKSKILGLFAFTILALVFLMSAVSAAVEFVPSTINQTIFHGQTSTTFSFQLNETSGIGGPFTLAWTSPVPTTGTLILSTSPTSINASQILSLSATLSNIPESFIGTITGTISVNDTGGLLDTLSASIVVTAPSDILTCNDIGNPGKLEVKKIDFTNDGVPYSAFGEDDDRWFPFEEIEVEIKIESDDYDIDDISVEWGIYSIEDEDWLIDLDEEDEVNIKDGDQETFIVTFKLDDDLDIDFDEFVDNTDNYRFYVVATGTIDDSKAGADDGEDTCAFDYESSSILIEDFVILDNIDMPETLSCGETVEVTADVWNIGDRDQDEVSVEVYGRESILEFNKVIEVGDIDKFDKQVLSFTFEVPLGIEEGFYALKFEVLDEDRDVFENNDDDFSEFTVPFEVEGACVGGGAVADVTISAALESGGKAGEELVISATITNNEDELRTFTVKAAGYAQWADSVSLNQNTLVLNAGESRGVLFTFDVNKDASGSQSFTIELVSEDDQVTTQLVSDIVIEERSGLFGLTGAVTSGSAYLWGIGLLNVILIAIIIIVAVRIARRK